MNEALSDRIFAALRAGEYGAALALVDPPGGDDPEEAALVACAQGAWWLYLGQIERAKSEISAAFELAAQLPQRVNIAGVATVGYLGLLALLDGRPHEAREQFAAAQVIERALKRRFRWLNVTWGLGEALMGWGPVEYARAGYVLPTALRQAREAQDRADELGILTAAADLALRRDGPAEARALLAQSDDATAIPHERAPATYRRRARLWTMLGDDERASLAAAHADAMIAQRAALIPDPGLRQGYLAAQEG